SEVWMIGDSAIDVETGLAAGARTIGCAWGLRGREELRAAGVEFLVEHPREIPGTILGGARSRGSSARGPMTG
ncbi:MAG TPA: HAD hydrolase-like protein, partial [Myxococcota bacterium]|nr:HAD hydrolase-like protein [Myxococcota bacterium]